MKKSKIFTSKQEAELNNVIKNSVNAILIDDDYMYEKYMEQLGSEF